MILVDDRIGQGALLRHIGGKGIPVVVQRLNFGDVAFDLNGPGGMPIPVGIELKKIGELIQCLMTKRLTGWQLPGMVNSYRVRYLFVQGHKRQGVDGLLEVPVGRGWHPHQSRVKYTDIIEWLTGFEIFANVHVVHTTDDTDTAAQVFAKYLYCSKVYEDHSSFKTLFEPDEISQGVCFDPIEIRRRMVALIPSIGWEKSKGVCEVFPRRLRDFLRAIADSVPADWTRVQYGRERKDGHKRPNMSKKTADEIMKVLDK